jgi:hypothetical protein
MPSGKRYFEEFVFPNRGKQQFLENNIAKLAPVSEDSLRL